MRRSLMILIGVLWMVRGVVAAQDSLADVAVTVQDNASLRAGPGLTWERIAVLPYGATYQAVGRTLDADWIQIHYEGGLLPGARIDATIDGVTYGWVAAQLLIWTGNILELPVDGVPTIAMARAAGAVILVGPNTVIYEGSASPARRVAYPRTTPAYVEVTGRLGTGDSGYMWVQFKMMGHFYWTSIITQPGRVNFSQLPDARYLYPYGRLTTLTRQNIARAKTVLSDIAGRWSALSRGGAASCNNIPAGSGLRSFAASDLQQEAIFVPLADVLTQADSAIRRALDQFRTVCAVPTRGVDPSIIQAELQDVALAERSLNLAGLLLPPIEQRDPLLAHS